MWKQLRFALAGLLIVTAIMKLTSVESLLHGDGLLSSPSTLALAIGFEFTAAILIALAVPRVAYGTAVIVFASLAVVAGWAWWSQTDCNCFGPQTPKGIPLLVDLGCLAMLATASRSIRSTEEKSLTNRWHFQPSVLAIALLFGSSAGGFAHWRATSESGDGEMPTWFGENLVGKPLPLLREEPIRKIIPRMGNALLVMLRPDCEHCRELAADWNARQLQRNKMLAVIGISVTTGAWGIMPEHVSAESTKVPKSVVLPWNADEEPFVAAPTIIALRDQMVVAVKSGDEATELFKESDWISKLFARE
jgi:hypothetical protein